MRPGVTAALLALLFPGGVPAQQPTEPQGEPETDGPLRDVEFGVRTRQFGLERRVSMYQWRREAAGYAQVWSETPIASAADAPPERRNPSFPLQTRYWIADGVTLDGRPLDDDVLKALGRWRDFRPNFSALPGNLSATFQPEGDGLGSAENPLAPRVGDLRITWRELVLPPLADKLVLQDGTWMLAPAIAGRSAASRDRDAPAGRVAPSGGGRVFLSAVGAALLLALAWLVARRLGPRRR